MDEEGSLLAAGEMGVCRNESILQSCRYYKVYSHAQGKKIGMKTRIVGSPNQRVKTDLLKGRHSQTENCEKIFNMQ